MLVHSRLPLWAAVSSLGLLLAACGASVAPIQTPADQPPVQSASEYPAYDQPRDFTPFVSGHRGGSGYAPEDTMAAYRNAARIGIDDFETDTQLTADGELVLIHDDSLDRTTNCTGTVISKSYAEVLACDAGYWWSPGQATTSHDESAPHPYRGKGVVVPKAGEIFAFARSLGALGPTVTIEIKNIPGEANFETRCETAATKLVQLIHDSGIQNRITVQSFDPTCIGNVKSKDASINTLYLSFEGAMPDLALCIADGFEYSAPSYDSPDFDAAYVEAAHAAGVKVDPWTADSADAMQKMAGLGVDGVITNFPACLMQLQGRAVPATLVSPIADATEMAACPD